MIDLNKIIWSKREYYQKINKKEDFSHPGFILAQKYCQNAESVLDIGCGDGSKLARLGGRKTQRVGVEVSRTAINLGKKTYKNIKFVHVSGSILPFTKESFDVVASFFVLEHTSGPDQLLDECLRVVRKNGYLILLAPNFGAPNRCSPNFTGSRVEKLIAGFVNDLFGSKPPLDTSFSLESINNSSHSGKRSASRTGSWTSQDDVGVRKLLGWNRVAPKIVDITEFASDLDTTVEPYILTLTSFLERNNMTITDWSVFWDQEVNDAQPWQKVFRFLGERSIYPFKYWGPHLFVVARKN